MLNFNSTYKELAMALYQKTMVGEESPSYAISVVNFEATMDEVWNFTPVENKVVSIEVSISAGYGASSATVVFECTRGGMNPFSDPDNFSDEDWITYDTIFYKRVLRPENYIQISLGYGDAIIPVLTGAIDKFSIDAGGKTITIECRDNMRYLIDQNINTSIHGQAAVYPKPGMLRAWSITEPGSRLIKVMNCTKLNVRSGPGTNYGIIGSLQGPDSGQPAAVVEWLSTNSANGWHNISYSLSDGSRMTGWISGNYAEVIPSSVSTTTDQSTNLYGQDSNQWLASSIIMDLAVEATTIIFEGENDPRNRTVCRVYTQQSIINDASEGIYNYIIPSISFDYSNTYFTACMEVVNRLGDVRFRANRYGDIWLYRERKPNQLDIAKWVLNDYINLETANYQADINDMRDRIIIKSDNGMSLFEMPLITNTWFNGVHRTMGLEVDWADTLEKRLEAARSAFTQMLSKVQNISVSFVGNPLMDLGDVCQLREIITAAYQKYMVIEMRHSYSRESGFVTSAELEYIRDVSATQINLITEEFPFYADRIRYRLKSNSSDSAVTLKSPMGPIFRAVIELYDGQVQDYICTIEIIADNGNGVDYSVPTVVDETWVIVNKSQTSLRSSPTLGTESAIGFVAMGQEFKVVAEETTEDGYWYGISESGSTLWIFGQNVRVEKRTSYVHSTATVRAGTSSAMEFVQVCIEQLGKKYVYGGKGPDVFDCSGLITYALRRIGAFATGQNAGATAIYNDHCDKSISVRSQMQIGDLWFYHTPGGGMTHVGVFVGALVDADKPLLHAPRTGRVVSVDRWHNPPSPQVMKYGRLKCLTSDMIYSEAGMWVPNTSSANIIGVLPTSFIIRSNYPSDYITAEAMQVATARGGEVLAIHRDHVLYKVDMNTTEEPNDTIILHWANINNSPVDIDLIYDVRLY